MKIITKFKRNKIARFCFNQPMVGGCCKCPLRIGGWDVPMNLIFKNLSCLYILEATERDINRAYKIIKETK